MREVCYLHLTRFVQLLLDRKDRMSMAVGLEVRVPFCDHRLVEYVFNTPWSLEDLRRAREEPAPRRQPGDLLPESVVKRVKSPYPSTQNPSYERAIRARLSEILNDSGAPVQPYMNVAAAREVLKRPIGPSSLQRDRVSMERVIGLNDWLAAYRPSYS